MPDDQIKHMVSRFLQWKLPESFNPDGGISFERICNDGTPFASKREPVGTNLLDAQQAEEMVRFMLASAPAPASGGVDAVALADLIDSIAKCHSENAMDQAFLDNSDEIAAAVLKLFADRDGEWACTVNRLEDQLASLSPAATPVSEGEPVGLIVKLRVGALHRDVPEWISRVMLEASEALAKPASSPAGEDVVQTLIDKTEKLIEAADDMGWSCNSSSADQAIREARDAVRAALSQSTSAGRVGE